MVLSKKKKSIKIIDHEVQEQVWQYEKNQVIDRKSTG